MVGSGRVGTGGMVSRIVKPVAWVGRMLASGWQVVRAKNSGGARYGRIWKDM